MLLYGQCFNLFNTEEYVYVRAYIYIYTHRHIYIYIHVCVFVCVCVVTTVVCAHQSTTALQMNFGTLEAHILQINHYL